MSAERIAASFLVEVGWSWAAMRWLMVSIETGRADHGSRSKERTACGYQGGWFLPLPSTFSRAPNLRGGVSRMSCLGRMLSESQDHSLQEDNAHGPTGEPSGALEIAAEGASPD